MNKQMQYTVSVQNLDCAVPATLWSPADSLPTCLVFLGHTGYGHKRDSRTTETAELFAKRFGFATLVIDGPVHGDRRPDAGLDPDAVKTDWQKYWHKDPQIKAMVADWRAAVQALSDELRALPRGYVGVSMGSLYGLPLLAEEADRFAWALVGMWGIDNHTGPQILEAAQRVTVPVIHYLRWDDQLFDRLGTLAVFDALSSVKKELVAQSGPHRAPDMNLLEVLVGRLAAETGVPIAGTSTERSR